MGAIHVTVRLSWPGVQEPYEALFLVDTGATDSLVPKSELLKLGFKPIGKTSYELANSDVVEYEYCGAVFEFMGETSFGRIIMDPDDCEPLLGVTILESVGITIDPTNRTLKRLPAIPLKQSHRIVT
jgi:clan AA aspartic protease